LLLRGGREKVSVFSAEYSTSRSLRAAESGRRREATREDRRKETHEINPSLSAVVCQILSVLSTLNALTITPTTSGINAGQLN
jgi:hypothetical protein